MSAGAGDGLGAALDQLWATNREKILKRAATLLAALEDATAGCPVDRAAAAAHAHALAGALGTYGRPGSALFAEVERVLSDAQRPDLASCAARVRLAVVEIDQDL